MIPLHDQLVVEPVEEKGILQTSSDMYRVCSIVALSEGIYTDHGIIHPNKQLKVGGKILVNHIKDYLVEGSKVYVCRLQDIVGIL